MRRTDDGHPIGDVLALPSVDFVCRLALSVPFLVSGAIQLLAFPKIMADVAMMGLEPAGPIAGAVIATQFGGSLLLLVYRSCRWGAGILAGFTLLVTLMAYPFLAFPGPEREQGTATIEHLALFGGLVMVALFEERPRVT